MQFLPIGMNWGKTMKLTFEEKMNSRFTVENFTYFMTLNGKYMKKSFGMADNKASKITMIEYYNARNQWEKVKANEK